MPAGKVKWFNSKKGYGFIRMEGEDRDIFVHWSGIAGGGWRSLHNSAHVQFDLHHGDKGLYATNVVELAEATA